MTHAQQLSKPRYRLRDSADQTKLDVLRSFLSASCSLTDIIASALSNMPVVLVVEDDFAIARMIVEELQDHGFSVISANSADDAVHILNGGAHVDIVFSDIQMPGRMTGVELAQHVRQSAPSLPVILTSGRAAATDETPVSAFIPKPYLVADVIQNLRSFLPASTPSDTEAPASPHR